METNQQTTSEPPLPPASGSAFRHAERVYVAFADGPMVGVYDARTPGEHWVWTLECGHDQPAHPRKWDAVYRTLEEAQKAHHAPGVPESASPICSEIDGTVECSQCGQKPDDMKDEYQPEVMVIETNFGEPYLFGVRCRICGRVAKAVGREAAMKRWHDGGHDLDLDDFGNDLADD